MMPGMASRKKAKVPEPRREVTLREVAELLTSAGVEGASLSTMQKLRIPPPPKFPEPSRRVGRTDMFDWAEMEKFLDLWKPEWRQHFES
jgi:hypothetical protein